MIHIVSLSGGMDSTTCLAKAVDTAFPGSKTDPSLPMSEVVKNLQKFEPADTIVAISVDYGQRHRKELEAAALICNHYDVEHVIFDMREPFSHVRRVSESSLLGAEDIPHGYYEDDNMKSTIVPNRNMMMTSLMVSYADAMALKTGEKAMVWTAVHAGDHAVYPDCRPRFTRAMTEAILASTEERVTLYSPFVFLTKTDIARIGLGLKVPFELTWTCYEGGNQPCGRCGTCVERIESFIGAGASDPVEYPYDDIYTTCRDLLDRDSIDFTQLQKTYPFIATALKEL